MSMANICSGSIISVGLSDSCQEGASSATLVFAQRRNDLIPSTTNITGLSDNIIEVKWPCGAL
jgi:hypothetical protein